MAGEIAPGSIAARTPLRQLALLWLGWCVLMLGFQAVAPGRFEPMRPDRATPWTADETRTEAHPGQPYLAEPTLNRHVAWDSEFYISIALRGYDDPTMRSLGPGSDLGAPRFEPHGVRPDWTSLNNAFFPIYPWTMRAGGWLLAGLGLSPVATVTTAGVIVSLLGTLAALVALADLAARAPGSQDGEGLRAASHLLVWPAAFFLAQVYTEGLFLGLSFAALALARRERWLWAALLAALAVWTRSTGALLVLPLGWMALFPQGAFLVAGAQAQAAPTPLGRWVGALAARRSQRWAPALAAAAAPVLAYFAWRAIWGAEFDFVETHFFGRGLLWLGASLSSWREALQRVTVGEPEAVAYYVAELWGVAAALAAAALLLRRDPALALYGLAILVIALTSGAAQGMHRYVMSAPGLFLISARLGRSAVLDRLWLIGNTLAMAVFALAFSWDFWAG
jgi:hypothetical protein